MSLNRTQIVNWPYRCGEIFTTESDFLTGLGWEIGDADHGLNMYRGFSKVVEKLLPITNKDIGSTLKSAGMVLLSSVGGVSGPLSGTFLIRATQVTQAHQGLTLEELYQVTRDGAEGVTNRGRAESDDKTIYDAWLPVVESLHQLCEQKLSVQAVPEAVGRQAEAAAQDTIATQTRKDRAGYPDERSTGHQDLGAALVMSMT